MSGEGWKKVKLEDVAIVIDSLHKTPTYSDIGYSMVRVTDIKGGFLSLDNTLKVSRGVYEEFSKKHKPRVGDIVFSRVGTYGVSSYVNSDEPFCLGQNTVFIVPKIGQRFFYYSMIAPETKVQIEQFVTGSTQKTISLKSIKEIEFNLPPVPTQTRIAAILSALDDKIELNRQTNSTLEAIAQAIFKEWFVDFRYPGATGEMEDSELGLIPKEWRVGRLGDLVTIRSGKGLKKDQLKDNGFPVLGANGRIGFSESFLYDEELILTGRVGTLGTFQLVSDKVWISDNVLILKPFSKENYHYAYFWLKTIEFVNLNRGSTQPLVTKTDLANQAVLIPETELLCKFDHACRSMFTNVYMLNQQTTLLTQIRDTLLPKLMLGEIEV